MILLFVFILSGSFTTIFGNNQLDLPTIRKCDSFINERNFSSDFILIPDHFLESGRADRNFSLSNASSSQLLCKGSYKSIYLDFDLPEEDEIQNFYSEERAVNKAIKVRGKSAPHFTLDGSLHYKNDYYKPDEFCLDKLSESELELKVCPMNCSEDHTLCVQKCCAPDEYLVYWNWTCKKVSPERQLYTPNLYADVNTKLPAKEETSLKIHYQRPFLNCTEWLTVKYPFSNVIRPLTNSNKPDDDGNFSIRYLKSGKIYYFDEEYRKWSEIPKDIYCIDGFANWGRGGNGSYFREEGHQVLFACQPQMHEEPEVSEWLPDLYAWILFISSIFILLTAVIHILLFDRQNIHGLTVISQSVSLFFMYIFYGVAHYVTTRRDPVEDYRSFGCVSIAVLGHFFFISTFTWLSVVNFDLWLTFRSMRPVSKMSKKMRRFTLYSIIGWGIPAILIGIFVFIDFHFDKTTVEIQLPGYGKNNCYVARNSRVCYNCSILAVVIPINLLMIISTFKLFYDFKKGDGPVMTKRSKSDKYSFNLFIKLFFVMGAIWSFDLIICWIETGNNPAWYLVMLDLVMFLQAIGIFLIFCWNRRTMKHLEEKYPKLKGFFSPMKKLLNIPETETDTVETTPGTPGGFRKMSITSSQSGTLDRKMSTISTASSQGGTSQSTRLYIN